MFRLTETVKWRDAQWLAIYTSRGKGMTLVQVPYAVTHNCLDLKGPILTSVGTTCTWIKTCRDKHTYTELKIIKISLKLSHQQDTFLNDSLWMTKIKNNCCKYTKPNNIMDF